MVLFDVVEINEILTKERLDAFSFVSKNSLLARSIYKKEHQTISELSLIHKVRNRDSRIYVKDKTKGLMYLSNTDISKSSYTDAPFMSIKFLSNIEMQKLVIGDLLTCAVGTIGTVCYVNKMLEGAVISGNILRFTPRKSAGFIYAFLQSRYGQAVLKDFASGSVQEFITPPKLAKLPIPSFAPDKQQKIHDLITESSNLRVDANLVLEEAQNEIKNAINIESFNKRETGEILIKTIKDSHNTRFEASYYLTKGYKIQEEITKNYKYLTLGEATSDIFRPGIFKRVYVDNGITFLGGAEIIKAKPEGDKKLSRTKTQGLADLMLKKHWILVTCGGTIGNMAYVDGEMEKCAASQHILRIVPSKVLSGYLYAYLSSEIGKEIITSYTYGSVIPQIEPHHISLIPVPILGKDIEIKIHELVMKYVENIELSKIKENQAIQLVEKEIEQWQQ